MTNYKEISIAPTDDAYVKDTAPNSNYGSYDRLYVGTYYKDHANERAYLKFNLSRIPDNAVIVSATLHAYTYKGAYSTPVNISAYAVSDDSWSEDSITWNNKPPAGELLDKDLVDTEGRHWSIWNVTSFVKAEFSNDKVVSFVLISDAEGKITESITYNSKESKYIDERPYLEIVYYVPVAISNLHVSKPLYTNSPIKITSTITNGGNSDVNVTYVLRIDNETVVNKTVTIPAKGSVKETYTWVTSKEGTHTIKAEILGDGFSDSAIKVVNVQYNPYILISTLSRIYANAFAKEYPVVKTLYKNFTTTIEELQKCGVDLGDLKEDVLVINEEYAEMEKEYGRYIEVKRALVYQVAYYYPATLHIRRAFLLGKDVERRIEKILPILQGTLEQVLPSCTGEGNQTNATATNVTITVPKVLIDLSHDQYYLKRYGYQGLAENIENELSWKVEINTKPLTYEELKDYDVLILTNPKKPLTAEEIQAIREFVQNGGGLMVAGDWYKYVNVESLNTLLDGTGISFEETELMDDEENSGKPYYPFVGIYNRNCSITKFIPDNWKMYFNGDTLAIGENAVWVIRGFSTAYAVDADENVVHEKGSEPVVAAAVTFGKGRIVAYGSSKAFSDAYHSKYIKSNWPFIKGALLWLVGQN